MISSYNIIILFIILIISNISFISCLTITIPSTQESVFSKGEINQYFGSSFFLPSCLSMKVNSTTYKITLIPGETLPNIKMYINSLNSNGYFTLVKTGELEYNLNIRNLCLNKEIDSNLLAHKAIYYNKTDLKKTTDELKILKLSFEYKNEKYSFYTVKVCNESKKFHFLITFILVLLIYCIIMFLVTTFQIDFQIVNLIHTKTRLKWWNGPAIISVLSIGLILLYYFHFAFWVVNFVFVSVSGFTCSQCVQWIITEIANMETDSNIIKKIQKFLLYEICWTVNVISLICSICLKIVFIVWVATQSVILGNLMSFCFVFVVISSIRVTKFKNCFWLLIWIIIYEGCWQFLSKKFFEVDLSLFLSQKLNAPTGIQMKNYECWNGIYVSELLFPALALKFCKVFDEILEHITRSYYITGFILIILSKILCFCFQMNEYYLIIVTIVLIIGLALKGIKDDLFAVFWKGKRKEIDSGNDNDEGDDSEEDEDAAPNIEMSICKVELKHIL